MFNLCIFIGFRGVAIKMKFVEETWDDELWNVSSHRFLLLAGKIKKNVSVIKLDHKALLVS